MIINIHDKSLIYRLVIFSFFFVKQTQVFIELKGVES